MDEIKFWQTQIGSILLILIVGSSLLALSQEERVTILGTSVVLFAVIIINALGYYGFKYKE